MTRHYLDHASTTPLRPEAAAAISVWLEGPFADPGRIYDDGRAVRDAIEAARAQVAALVSVRPRQVVFTSGATEAVCTAVWGATRARPATAVAVAAVEHSAVRDASARARVLTLPVDAAGRIDPDGVSHALASDDPPGLVHCQWANHEVATVQPVAEIVRRCREAGAFVHVDAAAAAGHVPLDLEELDADYVSVSAHKLGGPPGCGALIVRRGLRFEPLLVGGAQERGRRAGMENVPGILGFGAAAAALVDDGGRQLAAEAQSARAQVEALSAAATASTGVAIVGDADPGGRLPHVVCLGVDGVEAEPVVVGLDRAGIAVHSGSACSSEALEPSPVLDAMGKDPSHSLRLSVGWSTTSADVGAFAEAFPRVIDALRALRT